MNVDDVFRRNVRMFYGWLGSVIALGAGPIVARKLIEIGSMGGRISGVVVGMLSMVPWLVVTVAAIRHGDEFTRRLHLISAAITLAVTILLTGAVHWLERARFIEAPDLMLIWVASLLIWAATVFGVKRYFERAQ